ncbi:hypothetical protein [Halorubrum sp. GN11GM_10-3_MGM]|uniref:hypothetical protein n=1 Tax=Halorubrum sp. GN11GM_10-3_MGM TaxID=2518111 RepID=UPI0010F75911|nr:hypothetical protein [Halorubrum sp. GN11GM_10-3_MGM]TKX72176.1 hypothetical protein EXE40_04860 [Halorubrum sp. GN11GM_10-3_MGM]
MGIDVEVDDSVESALNQWSKYHDVDRDRIVEDALMMWFIREEEVVTRMGDMPPGRMHGLAGASVYGNFIDLE